MAKSIRKYLNNNEGVVPMADFLVVRAHILIEDIHLSEPVSAVHEVVFGDIERQSIYRWHIKHILKGLIILVILRWNLTNFMIEIGDVEIDSKPFHLKWFTMEMITAVALNLGN